MTQFPNFSTKISNSSLANTAEDAQVSLPEPRPQSLPRKPWLIVSLGNPGKKFNGTRHNVVFMMVDVIAKAKGISINTVNFKAQIGKGNVPVMLAKPQTFMNSSGESVGAIVSYYKIPLKQVLVFQQKSAVDGIYFEENDEYAPVVEMLDEPSGSEPTS